MNKKQIMALMENELPILVQNDIDKYDKMLWMHSHSEPYPFIVKSWVNFDTDKIIIGYDDGTNCKNSIFICELDYNIEYDKYLKTMIKIYKCAIEMNY